jgi:TIR domain
MIGGESVGERRFVFVSYSREDSEWLRRFANMLKPGARRRGLEVWSDQRNVVGEQWRSQLAEAIHTTRAALLLVSIDFLASDFIMGQELPALCEEGVPLVYVLVRPCLWDEEPALERVQWAHDPRRDGPVASSADPDGQIVRACKKLLDLLPVSEDLARLASGGQSESRLPAPARAEPLAAGRALGGFLTFRRCRLLSSPARSLLVCATRCWGRARGRLA